MPSRPETRLLAEELYLRAAALGRTAAGRSGPNPPVGCLIVRDGTVVGEGATDVAGGPHAEVVALETAGNDARGSVAVVTLEPCAHQGRTGPCTSALIDAGVREVHVVLRDPDAQAAGGAELLRGAGIEVVDVAAHLPAVADVVTHDLRGFLTRVRSGRPHVTLKLAQLPDGRTDPGPAGYLTGFDARTRVHRMRADVDAVLVGSTTVRTDDPQLDVRHVEADRSPRPVIVASRAAIDPHARAVADGAVVLVGPGAPTAACDALRAEGATIIAVASAADERGGIDLKAGLEALLDHRILTVLAEPGPRLAEALMGAGLVDEVELHLAGAATADVMRAPGAVVPATASLDALIEAWRGGSAVVTVEMLGADLVLRAAWSDLDHSTVRAARTVEAA